MECIEILSYTIPLYGNRRIFPYGRMKIEHEGEETVVRFGEVDSEGLYYITYNRKKYRFRNVGSLYNPVFEFLPTGPIRRPFDKTETISIEIPEGAEVEYNPKTRKVYVIVNKDAPITLSCHMGTSEQMPDSQTGYKLIRDSNGAMTVMTRRKDDV